jgi:hypothetical protein
MSSELRTKFLDHMTIQRFSNSTKRLYVRGVEGLVKHYGQPPDCGVLKGWSSITANPRTH